MSAELAAAVLCRAVRSGDDKTVNRILRRPDLPKIAVELAGLVPKRRRGFGSRPEWYQSEDAVKPHGTHAAFNRHKSRNEEPCGKCWTAEREYQSARARLRRAQAVSGENEVGATRTPILAAPNRTPLGKQEAG